MPPPPPTKESGLVRCFVASGSEVHPREFSGNWSTDGHAWGVIDIPQEMVDRYNHAVELYRSVQKELQVYRSSSPMFCSCGDRHNYSPPDKFKYL